MGLTSSTEVTEIGEGVSVEGEVVGEVKTVKIGHTWTIYHIRSVCKHMKTGQPVISPLFKSGIDGDFEWRLKLYPQGDIRENRDYISVYLQLVSVPDAKRHLAVMSPVTLSIIDGDDQEAHKVKSDGKSCFINEKTVWGFSRFIKRKKLLEVMPDNRLLGGFASNARLTLYFNNNGFETTNHTSAQCNLMPVYVSDNMEKLSSDFGNLLRSQIASDIRIQTETKEFSVHTLILGSRSTVFAKMFTQQISDDVLVINDVKAEIMDELLHFIYRGKLSDRPVNMMELLVAAKKYNLQGLKDTCEVALINALNVDNAIKLVIFAEEQNLEWLKARTYQFIIENAGSVEKSDDFKASMTTHPQLMASIVEMMGSS